MPRLDIAPDSLPAKACVTCGATKPQTGEFFYFRKDSGRFRDDCKECFKRSKHERYWRNPEHARKVSMDSYRNTDGAAAKRRTVAANPERYAAINARYETGHKEERVESRRLRHIERREEANAASREWYAANRERAIENSKAVIRRNPERSRIFANRTRTKRVGAPGRDPTAAELIARFDAFGRRCVYCGVPLGVDYHMDHVEPLTKGGSKWISNLAPACPPCNRSKFNHTLEEWLGEVEAAAVRQRMASISVSRDVG